MLLTRDMAARLARHVSCAALVWTLAAVVMCAAEADPWPRTALLEPAELARWITQGAPAAVVYVGPPSLARAGHIKGAVLHGPASQASGLADLKQWADTQPRSTVLVIYCGCCPFDQCPNVRPAYRALREMGFSSVRVLRLPSNFETDWVQRGLPLEQP